MATWRTKDGREIEISDMEDSHLFNSIRLLERKAGKIVENFIGYGGDPIKAEERAYEYLMNSTKYNHLLQEAGKRGAVRCEKVPCCDFCVGDRDGILLADESPVDFDDVFGN